MTPTFGPRRAEILAGDDLVRPGPDPLPLDELEALETLDLIYRSLCALMYNYVPTSGHPGGSISSGRFVAALLFDSMDYDVSDPDRQDADIISYGAGHKALGLYAMWAIRNEVVRLAAPGLLAREARHQFRLEDLLGFRRNPTTATPLFNQLNAKPLDGHPTPATPFIRIATGASGVGVAASVGLALGAMDTYAPAAPRVHVVEGEGGMTPGRVSEAMAAAGTASLGNLFLHVDWNQASIDSNRVCRDGSAPGDYVQWDPAELAYLHDWNVIQVSDGTDFRRVIAAQRRALAFDNGQPTAVVYRTTKGWRYGIEGKASHGAGHKLCTDGFFQAVAPLTGMVDTNLPRCPAEPGRCDDGHDESVVERCFWEALGVVRKAIETNQTAVALLARRLTGARDRLDRLQRKPRAAAPRVEAVFETARSLLEGEARYDGPKPGSETTLRGELGNVLGSYNVASGGALLIAAADLLGSTSVNLAAKGFPGGFYHARKNSGSRTLSIGGICEDAIAGLLSGLSSYGRHLGAGSSYGAFMAPLGHIAARLHAIGGQARRAVSGDPLRPFILICAHAGLKTGEDGPTHADPQALQLLQGNFPPGTLVTLTPWEPREIAPLMAAALVQRPAIIAPFVTRPAERVPDRAELGLAPAGASVSGVYRLRQANGKGDGTLVLQESGVAYAFVERTLPLLAGKGIDLDVYYVASAELFDALPRERREEIFSEARAREAMGITGFTLPTLYRWVTSERGRSMSLHPFQKGHFLGSGPADKVLAEAGLDGESQFRAIARYLEAGIP